MVDLVESRVSNSLPASLRAKHRDVKDSDEVTVGASAGYLEVVGSAFNQENGLDCEN